ncbi:unnamed protein product, partial [Prorocentrum cordatum]
ARLGSKPAGRAAMMDSAQGLTPKDGATRHAATRTMSASDSPRTPAAARSLAAAAGWAEVPAGDTPGTRRSGSRAGASRAGGTPASRRSGSSWRSWHTSPRAASEERAPGSERQRSASRRSTGRRSAGWRSSGVLPESLRSSREDADLEAPPGVEHDAPAASAFASSSMASTTHLDRDLLPQGSMKSIMQ